MASNDDTRQDHKTIFEQVYLESVWGRGSGSGSAEEATRPYRQFLQAFLRDQEIRSVVDLGCGDWQFSQYIDWTGIDYLGLDVSETALASARQFERLGVGFRQADATVEDLPQADLLIAKDVLQHWSRDDIFRLLPRLGRYRHVLVTNGFPPSKLHKTNKRSRTGRGRPVDLQQAPFNIRGEYVFSYESDELKRVFHFSPHI